MNKYNMNYNQDRDQWFIELKEIEYALHCGESFQLFIGQKPTPCRLELAERWYVVIDTTRFDLRESEQYMIQL